MAVAAPVVAFAIVLILIVIVVGLVLFLSRKPPPNRVQANTNNVATFGQVCNNASGIYCNSLIGLTCPNGIGTCVYQLGANCLVTEGQPGTCQNNPYSTTNQALICNQSGATYTCAIPKGQPCVLPPSSLGTVDPCVSGSSCSNGICV